MSSTFGHRAEQPHPEGYTLPSAQDDWSEPTDRDGLKRAAASLGGQGSAYTGSGDDTAIRWGGYGLAVCACALAFYDLYQPSFIVAAVLLALPLAVMALLLQSPVSFEIYASRWRPTRRYVNLILVAPFGCLLLPNTYHAQVDPLWPLIPAAVTGLAMLATAWSLKARQPLESPNAFVVIVGLCGALYGYGATALANIQFDTSAGQAIPLQVLDTYKSCGRSCSYRIELPSAGSRAQTGWVDVSSSLYYRLHAGDPVCQVSHPGALTLPWYRVGLCSGVQVGPGWSGQGG
jgi:hypothetical protein